MPTIAYFGPIGTFTEQAAKELASAPRLTDHGLTAPDFAPYESIPDTLAATRNGAAAASCVPVENSVEGVVPITMDSLAEGDPLVAVAEAVLPIRFRILVRDPRTRIRTVASHPHALAQVRHWLAANLPNAIAIATTSTAAAAVAVQREECDAAVTAPIAASHYGLAVLADDVADVRDAKTRFLLMCRPGELPEPTGFDRTSVVITTDDRVGVLAEVLTDLAERGVNLTRIESRPTKEQLGKYRFHIDLDGHVIQPRVADALAALHRRCHHIQFLGSYPKANRERNRQAMPDEVFTKAADWIAAIQAGRTT